MGTTQRTVVFLCNCGSNIANAIDLDELAAWTAQLPGVVAVERQNLLCSPDGKAFFTQALKERPVDRIVVAACSPRMHEKTFQELAEAAGLNLSCVQMANIREHCAWVTPDRAEATAKAKALLHAAVSRSRLAEPLERRTMKVHTDLLIVGGGIAGIEAALTAAKAGRKVTIVESDVALGGSVIKTEEVAPAMECSPCLLAPRLSAVRENPNITVISNAELTAVLGFYGNFTARIHQRARAVKDNCIACEACFEVCPVDVRSQFHLGLGTRKAIYTLFPGSVPATAVIDKAACRHFTDGSCNACVAACPFTSIDFEQPDADFEIQVGAIILATGFANSDVAAIPGLNWGAVDNILTLPEFERIASSNGPTHGDIQLRDGSKPKSVAVVHCAGSLRDDALPYCSRICCMTALKVGDLLRKQVPDAKVYNIHNDLVLATPKERSFYKHQQHAGTVFLRSPDLTSVQVSAKDGQLQVTGTGFAALTVDMVVLATGLKPAAGTQRLAELLNVNLDPSGFFAPDHPLLHATGASLDGIYVAGCAGAPCDIGAAVTQAQASAGDALSKLIPGREIDLEIMTCAIDEKKCGGCKFCLSVCPYKAISFDRGKKVSVVNEAICRGCGTCAATCPTGAAKAGHFTDAQIYAEIGGLLHG